jgi:hypothetical protein
MKSFAPEYQAALAARRLMSRDFLSITARNRATGQPETVHFWSDLSNVSALVVDPDTGLPVLRDYRGAGSLIQISDIPAIAGVTVQRITIRMSQLDEAVEQAVRLYDVKQARVEIHTGLLDPDSRKLVSPAEPMFVGFIDEAPIVTPAEGDDGGVTFTCTSHTQELARSNPATRSHADQQIRAPGDAFFVDAAVVGDWDHYWGAVGQNKVETAKPKGLFGWGNFLGFL